MGDEVQTYLDELEGVLAAIENVITAHNKSSNPTEQKELLRNVEDDEYQAKQILDSVASELRHLNYGEKAKWQAKLDPLNKRYKSLQSTLMSFRKPNNFSQGSVQQGFSKQEREQWKNERARLLGSTAVVSDTSDALARTAEYIDESLDIGVATTQTMQTQRAQITGWHDQVDDTDASLTTSRRILQRMRRRVKTNKLILWAAILFELGLLILIIYIKYYT